MVRRNRQVKFLTRLRLPPPRCTKSPVRFLEGVVCANELTIALAIILSLLWFGTSAALSDHPAVWPASGHNEDPLQSPSTIDFDTQIVPILAQTGCNAAACHGAAAGRGGFHLSLFSGDPAFDYDQIVRDRRGRRVNRSAPDHSLLLLKATQSIDHGGDERFSIDSPEYQLIKRWISEGAKRELNREFRELRIAIGSPAHYQVGGKYPLTTQAVFFNRQSETLETSDVTEWAIVEPQDESALRYSGAVIEILRPGRHYLLVRFLSHVEIVGLDVPWNPPTLQSMTTVNWIDDEINRHLADMGIEAAPLADDLTLVRRVYLDVAGKLPDPSQARQFLDDTSNDKYERLVDELLESDAFVAKWSYHLGEWLRVGSGRISDADAEAYHRWLVDQIRVDRPLSDLMKDVLTATGSIHTNGGVGFYRATTDPRLLAESVSEIWMGVQLQCANCHNHPLDRWTQADYHGLAAIFAKLDYGNPLQVFAEGQLIDSDSGLAIAPQIPGTETKLTDADPRGELANWLTEVGNDHFSTSFSNRVWAQLMGRGLFEPTEDMRATNPVSNPELLNRLQQEFRQGQFKMKPLVRAIVLSAAYRRAAREIDDRSPFFGHALPRKLPAPVLLDAVAQVTGTGTHTVLADSQDPVPLPLALLLPTPQKDAELQVLGICQPGENCSSAANNAQINLSHALHLLNGNLLNRRIEHPDGRLASLLKQNVPPTQILEEFYWLVYCRPPSIDEQNFWNQAIEKTINTDERNEILQDMVWSLLTSAEFVTNH